MLRKQSGSTREIRIVRVLAVALGTMLPSLIATDDCSGQVREIASRRIRGVAAASQDRNGRSVIYFNPAQCRRLGPDLCEFIRAHEYGHVNLRHLQRGVPVRQAEAEADRWAAMHASPAAVAKARAWFGSGRGGSRNHGTSRERAKRLSGQSVATARRTPSVKSQRVRRYYAATGRGMRIPVKVVVRKRSNSSSRKTGSQPTSRRVTGKGLYVPRGDFLNPRR